MRLIATLSALIFLACGPQVVEPTVTEAEDPKPQVDLNDPCLTWNDLPNQDAIIESHVLYRDFLKQEEYNQAIIYWRQAFEGAPMADGRRLTHFEDGILILHHFYKSTGDESYRDEILSKLLPQMRECAEKPGLAAGRQAFDLYYSYPDLATDKEIYDLFKMALDESGEDTPAFILNPFIKVLTDLHLNEEIGMDEARKYADLAAAAMNNGLANCGDKCDDWKVVEGYLPGQLDRLESINGFYDCDYYVNKYYTEFKENPEDCDVVDNAYIRLKWGGCSEDLPEYQEVQKVKLTLCKEAPAGDADLVEGRQCLENGDYQCAIDAYGRYVEKTEDLEKKAKFTLRQAKIAYAHLKNFPKARRYALKAAEYKSGWGEPYMLIGNLYASSGPLCGPGTGWDSQIVTWPAIDKWAYAKRIDPEVAAKANELIRKYERFMPDVGEIFQRGLKEGQPFKVGCWINETTTIRAAKG
jgi:hypothetical protein